MRYVWRFCGYLGRIAMSPIITNTDTGTNVDADYINFAVFKA
jgi:hypothetical protein